MQNVALGEQPGGDHEEQPFAVGLRIEPALGQQGAQSRKVIAGGLLAEVVNETVGQEAAGAEQAADHVPALVVAEATYLGAGVADHVHLGAELEHLAILVLLALKHERIVLADDRLKVVADAGAVALEQRVQPVLNTRPRIPSYGCGMSSKRIHGARDLNGDDRISARHDQRTSQATCQEYLRTTSNA